MSDRKAPILFSKPPCSDFKKVTDHTPDHPHHAQPDPFFPTTLAKHLVCWEPFVWF